MEIQITHKGNLVTVLIDESDYSLIALPKYRWYAFRVRNTIYARCAIGKEQIYMHRLIMNAPENMEVDHDNHNGLDNRRQNLKIVTHAQNLMNTSMYSHNTSGYRGVIWFREGWRAQIKHQKKVIQSPHFHDPKEAALLRDEIHRQLFGENVGYINFPNVIADEKTIKEAVRLIKMFHKRVGA